MNLNTTRRGLVAACATIVLSLPAISHAYGEKDAIRDCENRLRSEYKLTDFRDQSAEKLTDVSHHYKVTGKTKIDDEKHPFGCEIKDRHVVSVDYSGPEPEGLGTAEKLAIGAAAAIAAAAAVSELSKHDEESEATTESAGESEGKYAYRCELHSEGGEPVELGCDYSQRQGFVRIYLSDGAEFALEPVGDKPGNYRDSDNGNPVYRKSGLGDKGVIYAFPTESIYIYY